MTLAYAGDDAIPRAPAPRPVPLDLGGVRPRSYGRALLFALESSISLLRAPEAKLTAGGEVIQTVLRLTGPLFFGLAVLSLRGHVKRET